MTPLDPDRRAKLRFVRAPSDEPIDMDLFPQFLVIGPQRTGTTWLHSNLVRHPQVFMSEPKELYYFNSLRDPNRHPEHLPAVRPELSWYLEFFRPTPEFLAERDAECRASFGEPYEIAVRGEATATYAAALDREVIADILVLNPELRAIVMIRNPIERAWSHAKKDLSKGVGIPIEDVTIDDFRRFFRRWYQVRCGSYSEILQKWEPALKPGHLFLGRYDELTEDPEGLLLRIFEFLGVRADARYLSDKAKKRINATVGVDIPDELRAELCEIFDPELGRLASMGIRWDD